MATHLQWLSALALFATTAGCTLAKSVGDDPMMGEGASSGTTGGPMAGGVGSLSATSGNPTAGGASATATSTSGAPGFPGPEVCGVQPVPDGLPGFHYSYACAGGCIFNYTVPLPLPDDVGECLCEAADCGLYSGDELGDDGDEGGVGTDGYDGVCDVEIMPNDGPGYYEFMCDCDVCSVEFQDIHPDSVDALFEDELSACECLCLEAGCGYHDGGGGGGVEGGDAGEGSGGGPGPTTSGG